MKPRNVIILTLVIILLLSSWAIALAQPSRHGEAISYKVETGIVDGNGYRLMNFTWQISGALRGEGYFMPDPASAATGSGCCCTFLPCITR
jgi:hypothetical protein